jgi:glycosyltransferase involved in cell wall biosynthesis
VNKGLIIIPAFNEGNSIEAVLREIERRPDLDLVVVDDASSDHTRRVVERHGILCFPLPVQLGAWGATQAGLRYALREGYHYAVTLDADGQHPAAAIGALAAPIISGAADVTIGACTARGSKSRRLAWYLLQRVTGLTLEDLTSGFRVYNRQAIEILASREATLLEYQDIGVLCLLQDGGLRIREVEVDMRLRQVGQSKVFYSWLAVGYYMAHSMILGMSKRTRRVRRAES